MATYSFSQLEGLWIAAGGPKVVAPIAAAIALAESSGNPGALNPSDNGGTQSSFGLWQISNGTHSPPSPNWANPSVNAKLAVAKYKGAGNSFAPWGTYGTGAYRKFLPSGYVAPTASGVPASAGQGAGGGASDIQLTSFNPADVLDPFQAVVDAAQSAGKAIATAITNPGSVAEGLSTFAKDFNALASVLNAFMTDLLWLFNPTHWIRIIAFLFGVGTTATGLWALMRTGSGKSGDITLALGILLTIGGAGMLFIAFHNIPDDVKDLGGLLGWIAAEIGGQATTQTTQQTAGQVT